MVRIVPTISYHFYLLFKPLVAPGSVWGAAGTLVSLSQLHETFAFCHSKCPGQPSIQNSALSLVRRAPLSYADGRYDSLEKLRIFFSKKIFNRFLKIKIFNFLKILFILDRGGREGEREGEKHQCVVASRASLAGELALNPGMCPHWESNWPPFGLQASSQSTEQYQPGQTENFLNGKQNFY